MPQTAVNELLNLLDGAFDGRDWHSLLRNLHDISDKEWAWLPPGGDRSIRDLVTHVASCKIMYENMAFDDASLDWDDPDVQGNDRTGTPESAIEWLKSTHQRLRQSIAKLDDAELDEQRKDTWGGTKETRWLIAIMIQHDLYHSGEINHLRSLYQQDDRSEHDKRL